MPTGGQQINLRCIWCFFVSLFLSVVHEKCPGPAQLSWVRGHQVRSGENYQDKFIQQALHDEVTCVDVGAWSPRLREDVVFLLLFYFYLFLVFLFVFVK